MRSISNVVDVTNYVMLALGSPLHAYDLDLLHGGLVARRARKGEKVRTLDGVERTLSAEDLVIADGERAVGLAGIMGGEETEVSADDDERPARGGELRADRDPAQLRAARAAHRGLEPLGEGRRPVRRRARRRPTRRSSIVELSGARWTGAEDVQADAAEAARSIRLRPERASGLIGLEVPEDEQAEILAPIGFERLKRGFRVPTWRARDVTREVDLIEEVARFKLPEIPFTLPRREAMFGRLTRPQRLRRLVEDVLVGAGYAEAYTPTFVADGDLRLPEPLSAEAAALRTDLYASLLEPARRNADAGVEGRRAVRGRARLPRRGRRRCPRSAGTSRASPTAASPRRSGPSSRSTPRSASSRSTSGRASRSSIPGKAARTAEGWLGELHPAVLDGVWSAFELDLDALAEAAPAGGRVR